MIYASAHKSPMSRAMTATRTDDTQFASGEALCRSPTGSSAISQSISLLIQLMTVFNPFRALSIIHATTDAMGPLGSFSFSAIPSLGIRQVNSRRSITSSIERSSASGEVKRVAAAVAGMGLTANNATTNAPMIAAVRPRNRPFNSVFRSSPDFKAAP